MIIKMIERKRITIIIVATFRVARFTLQTPKLWLVGVATDRDTRHACLRFLSFYLFLFFVLLALLFIVSFSLLARKNQTKKIKKKSKNRRKKEKKKRPPKGTLRDGSKK